jgi:hypothetical protein
MRCSQCPSASADGAGDQHCAVPAVDGLTTTCAVVCRALLQQQWHQQLEQGFNRYPQHLQHLQQQQRLCSQQPGRRSPCTQRSLYPWALQPQQTRYRWRWDWLPGRMTCSRTQCWTT